MFEHNDVLDSLNGHIPLKDKLVNAHNAIKEQFPFIARIALALYDPETKVLKTYLDTSDGSSPLRNYQALIDDAPSLKEILARKQPRVVNDLVTFEKGTKEHTQRIGRHGFAASYTMPMFNNGVFIGFIFFNSYETDVFTENCLREIDVYGHLLALMVINELSTVRAMTAAIKTTSKIAHRRDPETGSHLDRMSRFSLLIAQALAKKYDLDDDYIEHVFMFAPLHDIGKIAIPDHILLKEGELTEDEMHIMQTHSHIGREMIDDIVKNFGLDTLNNVNVLRNIAEFHNEAGNGTGYPQHSQNADIPLEAPIGPVAE